MLSFKISALVWYLKMMSIYVDVTSILQVLREVLVLNKKEDGKKEHFTHVFEAILAYFKSL